jgi:hypothetical protein
MVSYVAFLNCHVAFYLVLDVAFLYCLIVSLPFAYQGTNVYND